MVHETGSVSKDLIGPPGAFELLSACIQTRQRKLRKTLRNMRVKKQRECKQTGIRRSLEREL